jgi:FKBP-type peptidyl-prolyl cis-trans isomerase FkpA
VQPPAALRVHPAIAYHAARIRTPTSHEESLMTVRSLARSVCAAALFASPLAWADNTPADAASAPVSGAVHGSEDYIRTGTGLQYADIKVGTGPAAHVGQKVTVHYTGWLKGRLGMQGKKFDSSRDRGEPFQFMLGAGDVIPGWDEGVQGMKVGGIRKLIVPAQLGYGAKGAGDSIPPNAALVFEVELLAL